MKGRLINYDEENFERKFDWGEREYEEYSKIKDSFPNLTTYDIINYTTKVFKYYSNPRAELVGFEMFAKVKTDNACFYVKFYARDDMNPNRWYNSITDSHLDDSDTIIYIRGRYSRNYKIAKDFTDSGGDHAYRFKI